ncbi:virB8 family protein [Labrys sp. 22185]|uniref:virB8 family protein n=1 Tax=Labrys sp. 22185 TaxID=3453888 RepID=UPI003F8270C9
MVDQTKLDKRYFQEAATWEADIVASAKRSRVVAWTIAATGLVLAMLAMACLALLLPLKSFEPYVVEVDKTTGFLEIKRPLSEGTLTQMEAITNMYVVRYIKARESYDPSQVKDNYELAQLLSVGTAASELANLYAQSNPDNPVNLYGSETKVTVEIKSIQLPNERTAMVRFSTQRSGKLGGAKSAQNWVALMHFRYSKAPETNSWRFDNPLGFQVIDYQRDPENPASAGRVGG